MKKRYLITSALPYANGPLHFGHLGGAYLPADVIVRHRRLQGHQVKYICGSDEHGVAIMLNAKDSKQDYKSYVDSWHQNHRELFKKYQVEFDFFGQTSEKYHEEEVVKWFGILHQAGLIETRDGQQLYCSDCNNHLPDRFVEGSCYQCGYEHARGDECPACGLWIEPEKLINPLCKICGSKNIKEATVAQYYLLLSKYHDKYRDWLRSKQWWRKTVYPYVDSLTREGLHDRAISRDLDWGIDVPLPEAQGKKIYVWFDAPIGYVSNTKKHLEEIGSEEDYLKDWWNNPDTEIVNFIGKDNIIFHAIIFPIMSMASGVALPVSELPANQYINLAGKPFSKSSGWTIDAERAIEQFGSDALRYYLISLIPENSDSSFVWKNFQNKVNNELANNIGNLVNRCLKFWQKNWPAGIDGKFFSGFSASEEGKRLASDLQEHQAFLNSIQIKKGLEKVMAIGHLANTFFSDRAPWAEFKADPDKAAETIGRTGIYICALGILLGPYLPGLSNRILSYFMAIDADVKRNIYDGDVGSLEALFSSGLAIKKEVQVLVPKIDDQIIEGLEEELKSLT